MKICPNCGSENIHQDTKDLIGFLGGGQNYVCENCDYSGELVIEIDPERQDDAKETLKDKNLPRVTKKQEFSKFKFGVGIMFLLMGIPLVIYSPVGSNLLVGALSSFIGILLLRKEFKKRSI